MRSFIKALLFDKEVVDTIIANQVGKEQVYNLLYSGKITMKEYLQVVCK